MFCAAGAGVSCTVEPFANPNWHTPVFEPLARVHEIPGALLVTEPLPVPVSETVSNCGGSNVALTERA